MAVKTLPSDLLAQASEFARQTKVTMECFGRHVTSRIMRAAEPIGSPAF
jgi:hypothetical protein